MFQPRSKTIIDLFKWVTQMETFLLKRNSKLTGRNPIDEEK